MLSVERLVHGGVEVTTPLGRNLHFIVHITLRDLMSSNPTRLAALIISSQQDFLTLILCRY